jgi:mRNA interferase MazF
MRPFIEANELNGIGESSRLIVDEITTVPRSKLGELIRPLGEDDMIRLSRALVLFGLAGT